VASNAPAFAISSINYPMSAISCWLAGAFASLPGLYSIMNRIVMSPFGFEFERGFRAVSTGWP
jgi:hypothetical protein